MRRQFQKRGVTAIEPGIFEVKGEPEAVTPLGATLRRIKRFLIGAPLGSELDERERLSKTAALAVIGADNIASSIYGPEAMMRALAYAGFGALAYSMHIALAVVALLAIVAISYMQTIRSYPHGGGSYIVTKDNLGASPGVVAASALMIDYVLDVAVSVAAGVQSITSVFPHLHPARVWICLAVIMFLMVGNLRGVRASGILFSGPVYLYVLTVFGTILVGLYKMASGSLGTYVPLPRDLELMTHSGSQITWFLLLRAFASGAVALTGVEAISNGVPAFRPPETRNARITLGIMASIFGAMFLGVTFLATRGHVLPDPREIETLVSRVGGMVLGHGRIYYLLQFSTALMLAIAANTAYADFPRLSSILARDRFLPETYAYRGERLAYSRGIITLSVISSVLIIAFSASLEALIPLFTVGVFIAFTLSETSMVVHWRRLRTPGWKRGALINAVGMMVTGTVLVIEGATKFTRGAWLVLILVPLLSALFISICRHFERMRMRVQVISAAEEHPDIFAKGLRHVILLPIQDLDRPALRGLAYAKSLTGIYENPVAREAVIHIRAVHVTLDLKAAEKIKRRWDEAKLGVPLMVLESPYRQLINPLLTYIDLLRQEVPSDTFITILVANPIPNTWVAKLLHKKTGLILRAALAMRPGTAVISVPYYLRGKHRHLHVA